MESVEQVFQLYHTADRTCGKFCLVLCLSTKHHIIDAKEVLFHKQLQSVEFTDCSCLSGLALADCFKHHRSAIHTLCVGCFAYGNGKFRIINQLFIPCLNIFSYISKLFCCCLNQLRVLNHKVILQAISLIVIGCL